MRPLKIAMIQSFLPSRSPHGGVGLQAHQLANRLVGRGHQVTLFTRDPKPDGANYDVKRVSLPELLDLKPLLALKSHLFPLRMAGQDFDGFDVVHAHGDAAYLFGPRARLVRTFHGSAIDEAISGLSGRTGLKQLYWSSLQLSLYPLELLSGLWASRTVGISEITRKRLPFIQEIIGEGVDTELFSPGTPGERHPTPVVLFVGSMKGRKRGDLLRDAFLKHVAPKIPEAELWMICEKEGEEGPIRYLKRRPNRELVPLFRKAWAFCLPSSYEGFGIPYVEAMATATPVVATPNPGAAEVLQHGSAGLLVSDAELGPAIASLLSDKERRDRVGAAGLAASRMYSFEAITDRYESLYRGVVSDRSSRP